MLQRRAPRGGCFAGRSHEDYWSRSVTLRNTRGDRLVGAPIVTSDSETVNEQSGQSRFRRPAFLVPAGVPPPRCSFGIYSPDVLTCIDRSQGATSKCSASDIPLCDSQPKASYTYTRIPDISDLIPLVLVLPDWPAFHDSSAAIPGPSTVQCLRPSPGPDTVRWSNCGDGQPLARPP